MISIGLFAWTTTLFKSPLSGLRKFLATENPLKMNKNAFYFILKDLCSWDIKIFVLIFFGHVGKRLDKKAKVNFEIYDTIYLEINNYNSHIAQYLNK